MRERERYSRRERETECCRRQGKCARCAQDLFAWPWQDIAEKACKDAQRSADEVGEALEEKCTENGKLELLANEMGRSIPRLEDRRAIIFAADYQGKN